MIADVAIKHINELNANNTIDPVSNWENRAVFLISGDNDGSVPAKNLEASEIIFSNFSMGYL